MRAVPCVIFEDEHLLVVNKPAGINTHAPAPYAGEGLYDWLRHREPRWASLAILHRLDKETSGVLVFGKTPMANRSLLAQFENHTVRKRYVLVSERGPDRDTLEAVSGIARLGDRYAVKPLSPTSPRAQTRFRVLRRTAERTWLEAEPLTGRTHQIRVHASAHGFPILGDSLYGGAKWARVCLHAQAITLRHPETQEPITFAAEPYFESDPWLLRRRRLIDWEKTTACRLMHGAADGEPGWYMDQLGENFLIQSESASIHPRLLALAHSLQARSIYYKRLERNL